MNQTLIECPVNKIKAKDNYRKTFHDKSLRELAQSIKENGVIEPIVIRQNGDGFELVAGERRLRASRMAGLVRIPAIVKDIADDEILKTQIIENVQRENVPFMEEARALRRLRDECALDVNEIAKIIGKSDFYVFYMLKLVEMSGDAQDACEKGELSKSVAWQFAKLPNKDFQSQAARELRRDRKDRLISERQARRYIEETFGENGFRRKRRNRVEKANGNDYAANWKKNLLSFSCEEWTQFQTIVAGSVEIGVWANAVEEISSKR